MANIFFVKDEKHVAAQKKMFDEVVSSFGLNVLLWRKMPVRPTYGKGLGATAMACEPYQEQLFVGAPDNVATEEGFNALLFEVRQKAQYSTDTIMAGRELYICSLSANVVTYKGMLKSEQVATPAMSSPACAGDTASTCTGSHRCRTCPGYGVLPGPRGRRLRITLRHRALAVPPPAVPQNKPRRRPPLRPQLLLDASVLRLHRPARTRIGSLRVLLRRRLTRSCAEGSPPTPFPPGPARTPTATSPTTAKSTRCADPQHPQCFPDTPALPLNSTPRSLASRAYSAAGIATLVGYDGGSPRAQCVLTARSSLPPTTAPQVRGNKNWQRAREGVISSPLIPALAECCPIIQPHGSDSQAT